MELSPFLSVSVREKNHFMKCHRGEWLIYGGVGKEKDFGAKCIFIIYIKFKSSMGSKRSILLPNSLSKEGNSNLGKSVMIKI